MKRKLFALLFIFMTIAFSQFTNDIAGWYGGAFYVPDGTLYSEGITVVDEGTLVAESLNETDFATNLKWDITNDLLDTGGDAAYTWSANQTSTLTQIQANLATTGVNAVWYLFTYTVAVTTPFDGNGIATITTGFASSAVTLDLSVGTHSVYFKSKTTPVDFVISVVSGTDTEGTWSIDDVTLRQIIGGNVDISGILLVRGVDIGAGLASGTDDQKIDVFSISGDNVELSLESDGEATKTVDISTTTAVAANTAKVTNTDDQKIDALSVSGNNIEISLEDDGEATKTLDISGITAIGLNTAKVTDDDDGVPEVYDDTNWDADGEAPTKNDVRDKVNTMDTAIGSNTSHSGSDGSDHIFIDQDLRTTFSPAWVGLTLSGNFGVGIAPMAGVRILLPQEDDAATPTLAFGDGNTGFYESVDNTLKVAIEATARWEIIGNSFRSEVSSGAEILNEATSTTNPVFAFNGDDNSGLGGTADQPSIIANANEIARFTENGILIDSTPNADHTSSGFKIELTAGEVLNVGDLGYQNSDGEIYLADATDATKMPAMFICIETASDGVVSDFLMFGVVRDDTWTWTVGGLIYATVTGTTGNTLSQTAPVGAGEQVQVVGVATHLDRMTFTPSLVLVEI